jgi:hypothetical protein
MVGSPVVAIEVNPGCEAVALVKILVVGISQAVLIDAEITKKFFCDAWIE